MEGIFFLMGFMSAGLPTLIWFLLFGDEYTKKSNTINVEGLSDEDIEVAEFNVKCLRRGR